MNFEQFGRNKKAFPQPVVHNPNDGFVEAGAYGADMGLNLQQYVWLSIFTAQLALNGGNDQRAAIATDNCMGTALLELQRLD